MKILLLHDYGTPTGGAELQMLMLRDRLRERGHEVRLLATRAQLVPGEILADYRCFGTTSRLQVLSQTANPSAYLALRRALADFEPDLVHVRMFLWQLSPLILPLLEGYPALYQTATYKAICPKGSKLLPDGTQCHDPAGMACLRHGCLTVQSWLPLMAQRQLWRRWHGVFRRVVALSETMRARLEAEGISPVEVIYNGVAERPMRPPLVELPTVVYAGRLSAEKGVDVLLRAFARVRPSLPEARMLVAGAGPERGALETLASELGITSGVTFLGHLPREEMERVCESAWVQAIPSLWEEPFGNVATEALMRGTAVVSSRAGGLSEIVSEGESGFLVPPGDVDALAAALGRLLGDRALSEQMGQAGHARARAHFSEERCADQFVDLYESLLAETAIRSG